MKINLNNRKFTSKSNSSNGEVSAETIFHYEQNDAIIFAHYEGGDIIKGHLVGKWIENEYLDLVYHHINLKGELMTGKCKSYPSFNEDGKIILTEYWQWTCKDNSKGESQLIEI